MYTFKLLIWLDRAKRSGVESMQAKWEEMFGVNKEEEVAVVEEVRLKKPGKKAVAKKEERGKKVTAKKATTGKKVSGKSTTSTKKSEVKKPKATEKKTTKKK